MYIVIPFGIYSFSTCPLSVKGYGMPKGGGVTGDLYLRFTVEFPTSKAASKWGEEERKALEDLLPPKPKFARDKKVGQLLAKGGRNCCMHTRFIPFPLVFGNNLGNLCVHTFACHYFQFFLSFFHPYFNGLLLWTFFL